MSSEEKQGCVICFVDENLVCSTETDANNIDWKTKLAYCLPELDWNILCCLCKLCAEQLDLLCSFRNQCVNSYLTRREILDVDKAGIKCKLCLAPFNFRSELTEHNRVAHHSETPHDCLLCQEGFAAFAELANHENTHYQLQRFQCETCNTTYATQGTLDNHKTFKHANPDDWEFNCTHCKVKYPNSQCLAGHVRVLHKNAASYACYDCGDSFPRKTLLVNHIRLHTRAESPQTVKIHTCRDCNSQHATKKKLEIHKISCGKHNSCKICAVSFSTKYLLNRHVRNVHATEKNYNCDVCNQKFASPVYLAAHKKYHSGDRPHICSFCGKGYITASDLYHHEKIHANKRAYKCEKCPKAFNTSSDLHKHRICVHSDRSLWKYVCGYCDKRFPLKTNLDTHTKSHTGERNYACHLCERRCINRSVLQRHIASHSNVRSYKCQSCAQEYKYQKSLDIHLKKVHGIGNTKVPVPVKRYFCTLCPKGFFANNKLQKHIRTHTGERPYSCELCDKRFIDKSYVKQHLRTAHNIVSNVCEGQP